MNYYIKVNDYSAIICYENVCMNYDHLKKNCI